MSNTLILQFYNFWFKEIQNYGSSSKTDADLSALLLQGINVDVTTKIDKVAGAVNKHFAMFDTNNPAGLLDSGLQASDFIRAGTVFDTRYVRKDISDTYDATIGGNPNITFVVGNSGTLQPFQISGKSAVVTGFNSQFLNGKQDSNFVLHGSTEFDSRYYTQTQIDTQMAGKMNVMASGVNGNVPTISSVSLLVDSGVAFSALITSTYLTANYYTQSQITTILQGYTLRANVPTVSGDVVIFNDNAATPHDSGVQLSSLATNSALAGYIPVVPSGTVNNFPLIDTGGVLKNSSYNSGSFAPYSHISSGDHDTRYYTQTQLTNGSLSGLYFANLQLGGAGNYALATKAATGGTTTANGTLTCTDSNGNTFHLLYANSA